MLLQLIVKAEQRMSEIYIEQRTFQNAQSYNSLRNNRLAGRGEWNPADEDVLLLAVDGKSYTWEEVDKMLMHYKDLK